MNQKKRRSFKFFVAAFIGLLGYLLVVANPQPVQAHHAADCSDVFTPLSSFVVSNVNTNKWAYERAMSETGVPWEMLAAIHYRETSFSHTNPGNGQGIFQFVNAEGGPYPAGLVSDDEFYRQLKFMANKLQDDYVWRGSLPRERRRLQPNDTNITLVKDTLFSYNGRAGVYAQQASHFGYNASLQPYEGSPYVMNRFDCSRARMGLITKDYGSMDGIDTRYGAFTVFARLRGDSYWRSISSEPFGNGFVLAKSDDSGDLRQWVLYGGIKQHVPDSQTIYAWGLQNVPLVTTTNTILDSISTGPPLGRLAIYNGSPIYFMDNGKRYKVPWTTLYNTWNFNGQVISSVSLGLFNLPGEGGDLAFSIKDPNSSTTYLVDGAQNGQTVIRPYQNSAVHAAWEGSSSYYTEVSADYFDSINNAVGSTITGTRVLADGVKYEIVSGRKFILLSALAPLYPSAETTVSSATITRFNPGHLGNITQIIKQLPNGPHYLIDNGKKHRILSANALTVWSVPRQDISPVTQEFLNLIPNGEDIGWFMAEAGGQLYYVDRYKTAVTSELDGAYRNAVPIFEASTSLMALYPNAAGLTGFLKSPSATEVYLVDGGGKRHPMRWVNKLDAWVGQVSRVTEVPDYIVDSIPLVSHPGTFVSDGSTNYILDGGRKWSVSAQVKSDWGLGTPETYSNGTLDRIPLGGALPTKFRTSNGAYVMVRGGVAYSSASLQVAQAWSLESTPVMSSAIVPNHISNQMLDRFIRSNVNGDNRQFVISGGNWYTVTDDQLRSLGGSPPPVVALDPAWAPTTITAWQ